MSLNWNFKQRAGELYLPNGRMLTLYTGNAYLIMLNETPDYYNLVSFWADAQHMRNCLGLTKGFSNCYVIPLDDWTGAKWVLYKDNCKYVGMIAGALVRAFDAVTVQILPTAPKEGDTNETVQG